MTQYSKITFFLGFEEEEDPTARSFFSEIISSISDVKFSRDGRYILARDYLSLKIWDVNMETRPVKTIPIHDHLRGKLCDLYENDCIFDKFECIWGGDDKYVLSITSYPSGTLYPMLSLWPVHSIRYTDVFISGTC